jgi:hypothetical protein
MNPADTLMQPRFAQISEDGRYRYVLTRWWDIGAPPACFIMLNPSTADGTRDDPTIRKCMGFARRWGKGGIIVVNLFAFRSTSPLALKKAEEAEGPRNEFWVKTAADFTARQKGGIIVAAWGVHGAWRDQNHRAMTWLDDTAALGKVHALRTTISGMPWHPLMAAYCNKPEPYLAG